MTGCEPCAATPLNQGADTAPVHAEGPAVQVLVCGDGPALVRGADTIIDAEGTRHATTRPVVGVCLCGRTQRGPWCDGTHKFVRRKRPQLA